MNGQQMWNKISAALIKLPEMYSTDGDKDDRPAVYLFGGGDCAWILWEYSEETQLAFGLCDLGLGFPELGNVWIPELKELRFPPFGLPIEMDRSIDTLVKGYRHRKQVIPDYIVAANNVPT
jgi:hypothetical protein